MTKTLVLFLPSGDSPIGATAKIVATVDSPGQVKRLFRDQSFLKEHVSGAGTFLVVPEKFQFPVAPVTAFEVCMPAKSAPETDSADSESDAETADAETSAPAMEPAAPPAE